MNSESKLGRIVKKNLYADSYGLDEDMALRIIMEGTAGETGKGFIKSLVKSLSRVLDTRGALVTEYLRESRKLNSLAFWLSGKWVEEYVYDVAGTPRELVVDEKELFHVPENVIELFPRDHNLKQMGAVSYMGMPLLDTDENVLGHLAVLHAKPMPDRSQVRKIDETPEYGITYGIFEEEYQEIIEQTGASPDRHLVVMFAYFEREALETQTYFEELLRKTYLKFRVGDADVTSRFEFLYEWY